MAQNNGSRVNFPGIPSALKEHPCFCLWKREKRNGKPTKVPYDPVTGMMARTNEPQTFSGFAAAVKAYMTGGWDGIGYRVSGDIGAIDIDHCIREDGSLSDVASSVLALFPGAYFERSPSGTGLRGFFRVSEDFVYDKSVYLINNREYGLEIYLPETTNRFVTITGQVYQAGDVLRNDEGLQKTLDTFMRRKKTVRPGFAGSPVSYFTDEKVIEHASRSASGEKFQALYAGQWEGLYGSQSDADMALISMLCFWCGCVEEQIDRIFRKSGLMRDKWDRMTGSATYGQITIRNAVQNCSAIYRPVTTAARDEFQGMDANEIQAARDRREREGYAFTPDYRFLNRTLEELAPHASPRYEGFQIGNGRLFMDYYFPIILVNETRKCWYIYDGRVWRPDIHGLRVCEMAKNLYDQMLAFANTITVEDTRKRFMKRVEMLDQMKFRDLMIRDAQAQHELWVDIHAFDKDIYSFNVHNGTIDLRTGAFRPHDPGDRITKITEVDYDPAATCPRWVSFLEEVFDGDQERIRYLQKAIGYAMTGDTRLECLFLLYGPTSRNGKGTTMETLLRIFGEYSRVAKPEMIGKKSFTDSSGPSEDVARLNGARLVSISEPDKSMILDAGLTKQMTGNNPMIARYLRENSFEFKPLFKLFIDSNHLPKISDMTLFESDRIRVIPFNRHFSEQERDIDLKDYFRQPENLSGILNWCLEGCRLYQKEGLAMPGSVVKATQDYRDLSDRIAMFTSQCLVKKAGEELRSDAVYTRYKDWCSENGFKYENASLFRKKMETGGFVYMRRRPWNDKTRPDKTTMVNDVTWQTGEEPEEPMVPEE